MGKDPLNESHRLRPRKKSVDPLQHPPAGRLQFRPSVQSADALWSTQGHPEEPEVCETRQWHCGCPIQAARLAPVVGQRDILAR